MLQVSNAVVMHEKTLSRATGITEPNGHLIRVLNQMHGQVHDLPKGEELDSPSLYREFWGVHPQFCGLLVAPLLITAAFESLKNRIEKEICRHRSQ
jgi:hypothetical protein